MEELKIEILRIWNEIPLEFIQKLIDSMPTRAYDIYKAKGGHSRF